MAVEKSPVVTTETEYYMAENDDTLDENDRPLERWAPLGANDGDDFKDDYKCSLDDKASSHNMDRLKVLEEEQEVLNSSLIALTTHFAQVQFRLRQIVNAPPEEKESLLKELEEFAFRGIPDIPNSVTHLPKSSSPVVLSEVQCKNYLEDFTDIDVESKIAMHKSKQRELINQLKLQLEDLEQYAYETDGQELPQSVVLERQNIIINHLKEKLNFEIDDLCKLPIDDLRWQVDHAIDEMVNPLKMKEQLVNQLKTQVSDLERFIHYLQGEVTTETLACTCACPVHPGGIDMSPGKSRKSRLQNQSDASVNHIKTINTVKKVITLLHIYLMSQLGCGTREVRRDVKTKSGIFAWRELRIQLDIAVEHVLSSVSENDNDCNSYEYTTDLSKVPFDTKMLTPVRKHLAIAIRDLMQHGLTSDVRRINSVVPFIGCFPHRKIMNNNLMHAWELILKYYEIKNGHLYNSSPAQRLSQSFNLNLNEKNISAKQSLLTTIGNIIATHTPYKRSHNSHFKAFISAALNSSKLVIWLKLILQCQYLLENYYTSWSYVVKTGFQDAFHTLDRLTHIHFDLPVDLAVRQFQNMKDAF